MCEGGRVVPHSSLTMVLRISPVASGYMLPNDTYLGSNVGALDGYGCSLASASSNGTSCSFNNTVSSVNVTLKNWSVRPFGSATTGSSKDLLIPPPLTDNALLLPIAYHLM